MAKVRIITPSGWLSTTYLGGDAEKTKILDARIGPDGQTSKLGIRIGKLYLELTSKEINELYAYCEKLDELENEPDDTEED